MDRLKPYTPCRSLELLSLSLRPVSPIQMKVVLRAEAEMTMVLLVWKRVLAAGRLKRKNRETCTCAGKDGCAYRGDPDLRQRCW
jgi:hypothetical protein